MSLRKSFISIASRVSEFAPLAGLHRLSGQRFILPFYHIVSDEACPHIQHLYEYKSRKQFIADIDYLAINYTPLSAADLPALIAGEYRGRNVMFLTFDDGLREMYEIVAPILLAKGIPAAFFLNTDYLDNKALMFRYHASLLIQEGIESHQNRRYLLQARNQAALDRLIPSDSMLDIAAYLSSQQPYMTSTQVQWLVDQGFAIGAHSCSHPYYSDLPLAQQLAETHQCLHILRDKFNITDRLFAFPFTDAGVQQLFFDQAFSSSQLDYTFGSAGMKRDTGPRQLQRMPMEAGNATAEQLVKSEYLYYLLRMPFFRNQIQRS